MFIEVPVALTFFVFGLEDAVTTNFVLYRSCYILLGYNETECALLGTDDARKNLEKEVQPTAAVILMTYRLVGFIIPILLSFIVGPWSNKHGRKPILLSSFTGFFLSYMVVAAISAIKWASPWFLLLSCIPLALGGGLCSLSTMCFCYVSDITSNSDRDTRMGIFEAVWITGMLIGNISSSYVLAGLGYIGMYSLCSLCVFLSVIYIYFFLPESVRKVQPDGFFKDLFDVSIVYKSIKIVFKPRQNKNRKKLCLLMLILVIFIFIFFSDSAILYLYLRNKFHWSLRHYTLFSSANKFLIICGIVIAVYILKKLLKLTNLVIVLICAFTFVATSVLTGLATNDWQIYAAAVINSCGGAVGPLTRSAISQIIPTDELGNVFSFTTSIEWVAQISSAPFYTFIYNSTITTMPNFYNFVSAILYSINFFIIGYVIILQRKYPGLQPVHAIEK